MSSSPTLLPYLILVKAQERRGCSRCSNEVEKMVMMEGIVARGGGGGQIREQHRKRRRLLDGFKADP